MIDQPQADIRIEHRVKHMPAGACVEFTVLHPGDHPWLACVAYRVQGFEWIDVPRSRLTVNEAAAVGLCIRLAVEWLEGQ